MDMLLVPIDVVKKNVLLACIFFDMQKNGSSKFRKQERLPALGGPNCMYPNLYVSHTDFCFGLKPLVTIFFTPGLKAGVTEQGSLPDVTENFKQRCKKTGVTEQGSLPDVAENFKHRCKKAGVTEQGSLPDVAENFNQRCKKTGVTEQGF
jgi:hypothetical protein